jgi:galactose mutarotase-like enzyme
MFNIQEHQEKFKIYDLQDQTAGSRIRVAPERGGIIIGFSVKDHEYLYLDEATFNDPATNVRGGIPILFPICGQLENDQYQWNGKQYKMKAHGFARTQPWEVIETDTQGKAAIKLKFTSNEQTKTIYPIDFELRFTYSLKGNQLTIDQEYCNHSDVMMPIYAGFHPYFKVGDKSQIYYDTDGTVYLDYADKKMKPFSRNIDLTHVSVARLILNQSKNGISFQDNSIQQKITLNYSKEFKYPLLWSTEGKDFLCVEPFMAKMDALNTHEDLYLLKPHGVLNTFVTITADSVG